MKNEKYYEGVIYEPSYQKETKPAPKPIVKARPRKVSSKSYKSQLELFLMITIAAGVLAAVGVFAASYTALNGNLPLSSKPQPSVRPAIVEEVKLSYATVVLTHVTYSPQMFLATDLENGKDYTFSFDGKPDLKDKYGKSMVFAQVNAGMIADISFDSSTNTLKSLTQSARAWDFKQIDGIYVDPILKTITYGNTTYNYNDDITVTYKGEKADISTIDKIDVLNISGYNDKVWLVEIVKSHGYLFIPENTDIRDATIELDTDIFLPLPLLGKLTVPEGSHRLLVKGSNISPFIREFTLDSLQDLSVDITNVDLKSSMVTVVSELSDFEFTVNGRSYKTDSPFVLNVGTYKFEAKKGGYTNWAETIDIDTAEIEIVVTMEEILDSGKLVIVTEPESDAQVYIDGEPVGQSPLTTFTTFGNHILTVKKPGYLDFTIPLTVDTKEFKYTIVLQPKLPTIPN